MFKLVKRVGDEKACVITFNYDCLFEQAAELLSMPAHQPGSDALIKLYAKREITEEALGSSHFNWNVALAYGVKFTEVEVSNSQLFVSGERFYGHHRNVLYDPPVLKLHGSLNWMRYTRLWMLERFEPAPPFSEEMERGVVLGTALWRIGFPPHRNNWAMEPVLITPVLRKERYYNRWPFTELWERARFELRDCRRLVVVGYSFPSTDTGARDLLHEAFAERQLEELIVVDLDPAAIETRIRDCVAEVRGCLRYSAVEEFLGA